MQEPITTIVLQKDTKIKVYGNIDKSNDISYYTFEFNENAKIVISKFDGDTWKIANKIINDDFAKMLGKLLDDRKDL